MPYAAESIHAELGQVIDAWPKLPEPIRAAILALVRASTDGGER